MALLTATLVNQLGQGGERGRRVEDGAFSCPAANWINSNAAGATRNEGGKEGGRAPISGQESGWLHGCTA